jgi:protein-tyrosine phosphatase
LWHEPKFAGRGEDCDLIDLHTHLLPGLDDGASTVADSLAMARAMVADGITVAACTPHILPGVYANSGPGIRDATWALQQILDQHRIPLALVTGADNHIAPDFVSAIKAGRLLTLADSRYVLVEPPHHVAPPRLEEFFFGLLVAGFVPVLTHPERLTWIQHSYDIVANLARSGVWLQVTAGSLAGDFGRSAQRYAERLLDEGLVHLLATDAHDMTKRPPRLRRGRELAERRIGAVAAHHLVVTRPEGILANELPGNLPGPGADIVINASVFLEQNTREQTRPRSERPRAGVTERLRRLFK